MCLCIFRRFPFSQYFLNEHNVRFYLFFFRFFHFSSLTRSSFYVFILYMQQILFCVCKYTPNAQCSVFTAWFFISSSSSSSSSSSPFLRKIFAFLFLRARVCMCKRSLLFKKKKYAHDTLCVFANVNGIAFGRYDEFHIHIYLYRYT